ncbi:MAG: sodium/solute symporter [Candidatus Nealsonbacteria bacterium]|nr:sodium/solute symporter [Candidatus Nealsonbacteria bacterium]
MTGLFNTVDWICVAGYFLVVFLVAFWATWKNRQARDSSAGYFLAGRNTGWFVIGASLFASNIGSEHLVGLAGSGASGGVAVAQFELMACFCLLILGWLFVPFYLASGVFTMPEFLERRYSKGARRYLAVISIIGYVLTKISVTIAAGGIVFKTLMGIDFWTGAVIVVVATGIYTVAGGLRAVLYTDLLQTFVLIGGSILITVVGLMKLDGWGALYESTGPEFFNLWKSIDHPDFPWTGMIFGIPIIGVWYWCTDQFIVQRVLAASDQKQARLGTIFAGYLKLLPLFIFVVPGMIAFALAKSGDLELAKSDHAFPALVEALLPPGVRGIMAAGLLAALMSSLSSVFNSCSTLITMDIYKELDPNASERRLVLVGQLSTVVLVACGLLWIPLIDRISGELYKYLQSVQAYISPPIAAVFLIGLFWRRVNARGAMASLLTGFVLGMTRLILELKEVRLAGPLRHFVDVNFLHFAIGLFAVCSAVLVLVSLTSAPPKIESLEGVCMAGRRRKERLQAEGTPGAWFSGPLVLTLVLLALIGVIYVYFTG